MALATVGAGLLVEGETFLNKIPEVQAITVPENLWYWVGNSFRAFMSNLDGIKPDANGILLVNPNDIGPHLNFRIQPKLGGFDYNNWHIQYFEDAKNFYFKGVDSKTGFSIGDENGLIKYSKFGYSLETAARQASFDMGQEIGQISDGLSTVLPTGQPASDYTIMANELMNGGDNTLTLEQMLLPLAQETIKLGVEAFEAIE